MGELTDLLHRAYAPLAAQGLHYWATHQSVADTAERCAHGETWLAEVQDRVVGTITLSPPDHRGRLPWFARPDVAKFSQFAVDPDFGGRGVGGALMSHVEQRARALGAAELGCDTSEHADALIATYERRGYRFVGHADWRPTVNYRSVVLSLRLDGTHPTPILTTERLRLRPVGLRDAPAIHRYFADWEVIRHLTTAVPWPYPDDGARRFLEDIVLPAVEAEERLLWAMALREYPQQMIGGIEWGVEADDNGSRGFWLGQPFWRKGLMTEAITAVQDYLFFELGIDRLLLRNGIDNEGSRRVKQKTGAVRLGVTSCRHHDGDAAEEWEVTRDGWARLRGRQP